MNKTKNISIEPGRKGSSVVSIEAPDGKVYVVGFLSPLACNYPKPFSDAICAIVDKWSEMKDVELFSFLSQKLAVNGYEMPIYIQQDKNEERIRIGKRVKELRERNQMDVWTLAEKANVDAANVFRIEEGKYSAPFDVLSKIAYALGAKVDLVEQ